MADSSQLTQGGSKVRRPCQSTIVGAACTELRHSDSLIWERDFKKHWVDFIIIGWMVYTHFQHTFMFKQLEVNFVSDGIINTSSSKNQFLIVLSHQNPLTFV